MAVLKTETKTEFLLYLKSLQGAHAGLNKVLKGFIFVFPFIRLLERSHFKEFSTRGLIKVYF